MVHVTLHITKCCFNRICRYDLLEQMPPWMGGGEMIQDVFLDHSTYAPPPARFEAGTPAVAEAIGFGAAVDYLSEIGMDKVCSVVLLGVGVAASAALAASCMACVAGVTAD